MNYQKTVFVYEFKRILHPETITDLSKYLNVCNYNPSNVKGKYYEKDFLTYLIAISN